MSTTSPSPPTQQLDRPLTPAAINLPPINAFQPKMNECEQATSDVNHLVTDATSAPSAIAASASSSSSSSSTTVLPSWRDASLELLSPPIFSPSLPVHHLGQQQASTTPPAVDTTTPEDSTHHQQRIAASQSIPKRPPVHGKQFQQTHGEEMTSLIQQPPQTITIAPTIDSAMTLLSGSHSRFNSSDSFAVARLSPSSSSALSIPAPRRKLTAHSMDSDDDSLRAVRAQMATMLLPSIGCTDDEQVCCLPSEQEIAAMLAAEMACSQVSPKQPTPALSPQRPRMRGRSHSTESSLTCDSASSPTLPPPPPAAIDPTLHFLSPRSITRSSRAVSLPGEVSSAAEDVLPIARAKRREKLTKRRATRTRSTAATPTTTGRAIGLVGGSASDLTQIDQLSLASSTSTISIVAYDSDDDDSELSDSTMAVLSATTSPATRRKRYPGPHPDPSQVSSPPNAGLMNNISPPPLCTVNTTDSAAATISPSSAASPSSSTSSFLRAPFAIRPRHPRMSPRTSPMNTDAIHHNGVGGGSGSGSAKHRTAGPTNDDTVASTGEKRRVKTLTRRAHSAHVQHQPRVHYEDDAQEGTSGSPVAVSTSPSPPLEEQTAIALVNASNDKK